MILIYIIYILRSYIHKIYEAASTPEAASSAIEALITPRYLLVKERVLFLCPTNLFFVNHCHSAAWEQDRSCRVGEDAVLVFDSNFSLFRGTVNGKTALTN